MRRHTLRVIGIFSLQIIGLFFLGRLLAPGASVTNAQSNVTLEEIDLGITQTLKSWYDDQLTHTSSITYFGAYITLPVTDTLYIGLGSARPAENSGDGAYFAKLITNTTSLSLTGIAEPNEQGFHEMIYDSSLIHIAGTDPMSPDDWSAGNHYTYSPGGTFTKYRDATNGLKNVIHTWGLWKSGLTLYAAVSSHTGTSITHTGQIFTSTNNGLTWTHTSDLGGYRAYDIIGFDDDLYAIYNDKYTGVLTMTKSTDGGATWSDIITDSVRRVHIVKFNSQLIAVSFDREYLYTINISDTVTTRTLPTGYRVGATYSDKPAYTDYNVMAVAKGYLYLIAEKQSPKEQAIIRTSDLSSWERMVHTDTLMISLSYWADKEWLVVATPGTDAKLLKVDLSGSPAAITLRALQARTPSSAWLPVGLVCWLLIFLWWKYAQGISH
ncbi:MAG: glycoside hydrolase [Anaerolineae bacterium]|nr:glycoside hydrolase [Anaerolineae bacterium]